MSRGLLILLAALSGQATALRIAAVGDVMLARGVAKGANGRWERIFADVAPILRGAGLAFGNLESPLTTAPAQTRGIDLRADPRAVRALTFAGFDVLSARNNHARDGGASGARESAAVLRRAGISPLGGEVLMVRRGGLRLAWLAFLDDGRPLNFAAVRRARRSADVVLVSVHWGAEYGAVTKRQRRLARELAASGADVILGSGPHVLQSSERIGRTLVLYSLGNFVFDGDMPATRAGAVVLLDVRRGRVSACPVPTKIQFGRVLKGTVPPRILGLPGCA